jgi:hypothetical protein
LCSHLAHNQVAAFIEQHEWIHLQDSRFRLHHHYSEAVVDNKRHGLIMLGTGTSFMVVTGNSGNQAGGVAVVSDEIDCTEDEGIVWQTRFSYPSPV